MRVTRFFFHPKQYLSEPGKLQRGGVLSGALLFGLRLRLLRLLRHLVGFGLGLWKTPCIWYSNIQITLSEETCVASFTKNPLCVLYRTCLPMNVTNPLNNDAQNPDPEAKNDHF